MCFLWGRRRTVTYYFGELGFAILLAGSCHWTSRHRHPGVSYVLMQVLTRFRSSESQLRASQAAFQIPIFPDYTSPNHFSNSTHVTIRSWNPKIPLSLSQATTSNHPNVSTLMLASSERREGEAWAIKEKLFPPLPPQHKMSVTSRMHFHFDIFIYYPFLPLSVHDLKALI